MTLELADRSVSKPIGIAKDVKVKVGMFHFPSAFVVVDFEPDPRVPLILGRCFLKTDRALIDVHKGKFDGKADEGFFVGYSVNSKAFRVFNSRTRIVQEILHINFLENKPNVAGIGLKWLFDIDTFTKSMNYQPVVVGNLPNDNEDPQNTDADAAFDVKENATKVYVSPSGSDKTKKHDNKDKKYDKGKSHVDLSIGVRDLSAEFKNFLSTTLTGNKKDEREIVIRNKARLVVHGYNQEEGIDYDEVFAPVAMIEAIGLFLAYASFMGFEDFDYPDKVYKVVKALCRETLTNYLLENGFQRGKIDQTFFIKKKKGDILLVQVYVDDIIFGSTNKELCKAFEKLIKDKKFGFKDVKSASTPIETEKPLLKDPDDKDVDVHIYRYLKSKPHLGLWYPKDSLFNPVAYYDSDYDPASLDRKSTTGGCRLIYWQCKKQTVVATSSTEAEYIAAASCCAQVLWIQNQLLDYGEELTIPRKMTTEDVIRQDLRLDDVDGVECLPNEEIFVELARMGYEKPPPKLTFYKVFFSAQWKFLIHTLVQCVSAKRTVWNEFSCSMAFAVICLPTVVINNQVDDLTSHNTKYTSLALTQKGFANMRRVGNGFSVVKTPLFVTMLVKPQEEEEDEEDDDDEMPNAPSPPTEQDPIPIPYTIPPASPPQEQPTATSESTMSLLNTLMETCTTLSQKVYDLEQDKHTQALEIIKLKKRVKKLEKKKKSKSLGLKRLRKGRIDQDVSVATKDVSATEPSVFDDEEVTMTMAQTLIKMKAKKEDIDWNSIAEQIEEKPLDNIRKYQSLKRKHVSIAQTRKNMIIYLKNMAGYKMEHFKGMTYDKVKYPIIDWEIRSEGSRTYWKIIRVSGITEAYKSFEDMLKGLRQRRKFIDDHVLNKHDLKRSLSVVSEPGARDV
nr:putative ribonuclease H-like domain-containing protein [Tanacetum cinerariifolium]